MFMYVFVCVKEGGKHSTINLFFFFLKSLPRPSGDSQEHRSDESNIFYVECG